MGELIAVVNDRDEVVGSAPRNSFDSRNDIFHRVAGLWVFNEQRQVLVAQRSLLKKNAPGEWGPSVGGTVEASETYLENITKEAEEEIGLTGVEFTEIEKFFVRQSPSFFIQYFRTHVNWSLDQFTLQADEVGQVQWVAVSELASDVNNSPEKYISSMPFALEAAHKALSELR